MCNDSIVFTHRIQNILLQTFISEVEAVTNYVIWAWTNRKWVVGDLCQPREINLYTTGRAAMF